MSILRPNLLSPALLKPIEWKKKLAWIELPLQYSWILNIFLAACNEYSINLPLGHILDKNVAQSRDVSVVSDPAFDLGSEKNESNFGEDENHYSNRNH